MWTILLPEGKQTTVRMHNVILGLKRVDHADGDGLNNQRLNLRPFFKGQNAMNKRKPRKYATSIYKGVSKHKKKWKATIQAEGRSIYLGTFDTEIEAAVVYDVAAKKYFKEFARPNFPA